MRIKDSARSCIRLLTRHVRFRIRAGPCRGFWWSVPTRLRFLSGSYEPAFARFVAQVLKPVDVVWDVGAHFGYYTLLAARAAAAGRCYAFEPASRNLWYLNHHVSWNHLANATVRAVAIAGADGSRQFGTLGTGSGSLDSGHQTVQARSVDSLVRSGECRAPTFLKMDAEGAEAEILNGAMQALAVQHPTLCIATHGVAVHARCQQAIAEGNYRMHSSPRLGLLIAVGAGHSISEPAVARLFDST